jgi:hypothetical protein
VGLPRARDHTIASAYPVRGVPEATVPARFAELGDLHQGIDDSACKLDTLLQWAERDQLD